MAVDLTRFDFHAKRFYFSESVRMMSAEEVGQYLLLLVEAWMGGKDASLPDNPKLLARYARVDQVSEAVLEMFPVVETESGPRRRNETLFEEWNTTLARSEEGRRRAEGRWGKSDEAGQDTGTGQALPGRSRGNAVAVLVHSPSNASSNAQTKPSQTNPTQTNPNQEEQPGHDVAAKNPGGSDWHNLSFRHKRLLGKAVTGAGPHKPRYAAACEAYGEAVVLECFEEWALAKREWVKTGDIASPLFLFWKDLPGMAEDAVAVKRAEKQEAIERQQAAQVVKARELSNEAFIQQQKDEHGRRWTAEPPPQNGGSVLDYLADLETDETGTQGS